MKKIRVVIPTYNERDNLLRIYRKYNYHSYQNKSMKRDIKFYIVDDSPDNETFDIVEDIEWMDGIHNAVRLGYGKSLLLGLSAGVLDNADTLITMDADHPVEYLGKIIYELRTHDVVVGIESIKNKERYVTGWLCRNILRLKLRHPTCGYIGFNHKALISIDPLKVKSNWDISHVELLKMCQNKGLNIGEFEFDKQYGERDYTVKRILIWLKDFCILFVNNCLGKYS